MREIKYKAWYKPLGVMIEPENLLKIELETKVLGVYMEMDGRGYHELRMYDFEMMQYTGLKDKNGREIYEGDIAVSFKKQYEHSPTTNIVQFIRGCWRLKAGSMNDVPLYNYDESELGVIGNIYENPELIGGDPQ